jgi:hypothetical protein
LRLRADGALGSVFRWQAGLHYWPERTTDGPDRFSFGLTAGQVGACAGGGRAGLRFSGCAALHLGALHAVVHSPIPTDAGDRLWSAAELGARLDAQLTGPLWLAADLSALVPFERPAFGVQGREERVFQQAPVVGTASVGLSLRFR